MMVDRHIKRISTPFSSQVQMGPTAPPSVFNQLCFSARPLRTTTFGARAARRRQGRPIRSHAVAAHGEKMWALTRWRGGYIFAVFRESKMEIPVKICLPRDK
jgi:hypothetical protein